MDEKMITPFFPTEKIKEAVNAINQKEEGERHYPLISGVQIGEYLAEEMLKQEEKQTVVPNFFAEISKLAVQNEQEKAFKFQPVSGIPYLCFPDIYMTEPLQGFSPVVQNRDLTFYAAEDGLMVESVKNGETKQEFVADAMVKVESAEVVCSEKFDEEGRVFSTERQFFFDIVILTSAGVKKVRVSKEEILQGTNWLNGNCFQIISVENKKNMQKYLAGVINTGSYPISFVYDTPGWKQFESGRWGFLTERGIIGGEHRTVRSKETTLFYGKHSDAKITMEQVFCGMWKSIHIFNDVSVGYFLLNYTLLATMTTLFREAGLPIKFVVALIGETGSRKTSAALAMCEIYNRGNLTSPRISFRSTQAAIYEAMEKCPDSVMIFDDLLPQDSAQSQKEQDRKLESIIRGYGDRVPRKRNVDFAKNPEKTKQFYPVLNCALITGEIFEATVSSRLRTIVLQIDKKTVNNQMLTLFQNNSEILTLYVEDFLKWVTANQEVVLKQLHKSFKEYRSMELGLCEPRSKEVLAIFWTLIDVHKGFMSNRGYTSVEQVEALCQDSRSAVLRVLKKNENYVRKSDPMAFIFHAIHDALNRGISKIRDVNEQEGSEFDIYKDDENVYVMLESLFGMCQEYEKRYGVHMIFSSKNKLASFLKEKNLIRVEKERDERVRTTIKVKVGIFSAQKRFLDFPSQVFWEKMTEFDEEVLV